MINKAIIVGNLGADPDIKETNAGKKFAKLNVATSKRWKQGDDWVDKTQWHNVVVWNPHSAAYLQGYAKKGSKVYIEGEIETRKYEKDGTDRYITEIVVSGYGGEVKILDGKGTAKKEEAAADDFGGADDLDDEIPF